jgi:putative transposase
MDGRGCWRDNVFVERLWRSVKYEEVYLHAYETVSQAREGIARYFGFFNAARPHRAHGAQDARQRVLRDVAGDRESSLIGRRNARPTRVAHPRRSCVRRKRRSPAAVDNPAPRSARQAPLIVARFVFKRTGPPLSPSSVALRKARARVELACAWTPQEWMQMARGMRQAHQSR